MMGWWFLLNFHREKYWKQVIAVFVGWQKRLTWFVDEKIVKIRVLLRNHDRIFSVQVESWWVKLNITDPMVRPDRVLRDYNESKED